MIPIMATTDSVTMLITCDLEVKYCLHVDDVMIEFPVWNGEMDG